jgi:hypothetical protein
MDVSVVAVMLLYSVFVLREAVEASCSSIASLLVLLYCVVLLLLTLLYVHRGQQILPLYLCRTLPLMEMYLSAAIS